MAITFHPNARDSFDKQAEALLLRLSTQPPPPTTWGWAPPLHDSGTVGIGEGSWFENPDLRDGKGFLVVWHKPGWVGLWADAYVALDYLTGSIHRADRVSRVCGRAFVRDSIVGWLRRRKSGDTCAALSESLLAELNAAVKSVDVWVPVSFLHVESAFCIGDVTFRMWQPEIVDDWLKAVSEDRPEDERETLVQWIESRRSLLQGHAAAVVSMEAEQKFAVTNALDRADAALGILRLYSPANVRGETSAYCALERDVHMHGAAGFVFEAGGLPRQHDAVTGNREHWVVTNGDLADFRAMGLDAFGALLAASRRTPFQEKALSALLLYTRGAIKEDLSDRVVYQLAGLESLLILGKQEQLMQNLRERLAFCLEQTLEGREAVVEAVNKLYELRSGIVHHGRPVEDAGTFNSFAVHGWRFFVALADNLHFQDHADFVRAVDRIKFAGSLAPVVQARAREDGPRIRCSIVTTMSAIRQARRHPLRFTQEVVPIHPETSARLQGAATAIRLLIHSALQIDKPSLTIECRKPMIRTVMKGRDRMGTWAEGQKGRRYTISWSAPLEVDQELEAVVYSSHPNEVLNVYVVSLAE